MSDRSTDSRSAKPPLAAILGPDGSGKSTVIEGLVARLADKGIDVTLIHWRPNLVSRSRGDGTVPVTNPHGERPRSYFESVLKLGMLFCDWWAGYLATFRKSRAAGRIVLCDRHYYDLLVDPIRYRFKGPRWLARLVFAAIPNPTVLLLLDVPAEEIQRRKQEVPLEESQRQVAAYRELVSVLPYGAIIDANRPPSEVADEAARRVLDHYPSAL